MKMVLFLFLMLSLLISCSGSSGTNNAELTFLSLEGSWSLSATDCDEGCPGDNPSSFIIDDEGNLTITFTESGEKSGTVNIVDDDTVEAVLTDSTIEFTLTDQNGDGKNEELATGGNYYSK